MIRPQRATEVRRFSMRQIEKTRFIRAAIETEVLRRASALCDAKGELLLHAELEQQKAAVRNQDVDSFGRLDYEFHKILCEIACKCSSWRVFETSSYPSNDWKGWPFLLAITPWISNPALVNFSPLALLASNNCQRICPIIIRIRPRE